MPPSPKSQAKRREGNRISAQPEKKQPKIGSRSDLANKKLSLKKVPSTKTFADNVLRALKVSPVQLQKTPDITAILKEVPGGIKFALAAMRLSESPLIIEFLGKWDKLPERYQRERRSLEACALHARIDVRHLWGEIMLAIRERSVHMVKVIATSAHPELVKKRIEFANLPGGVRDRDALDTMLGALPSNKGTTFINKFFAGKPQEETEQAEPQDEMADDLDYIFPDASVMQEKIVPLRQKLLEGD